MEAFVAGKKERCRERKIRELISDHVPLHD
jgi:hypothetical protein